jgi:hypothetical protein
MPYTQPPTPYTETLNLTPETRTTQQLATRGCVARRIFRARQLEWEHKLEGEAAEQLQRHRALLHAQIFVASRLRGKLGRRRAKRRREAVSAMLSPTPYTLHPTPYT